MVGNTTEEQQDKARRKAAVEALARFQKKGSLAENAEQISQLLAEETDRSAIMIVASLLEDVLADRILDQFRHAPRYRKDLLRTGGPLGSFVAKIQVALAMGLLTEEAVESLELLRVMRNACAHSRLDINLRTPELKEVFLLFMHGDMAQAIRESDNAEGHRLAFTFVYAFLLQLVMGRPPLEAKAFTEDLMDRTAQHIGELHAQLRASRGTQTTQSAPADRPVRKGRKLRPPRRPFPL